MADLIRLAAPALETQVPLARPAHTALVSWNASTPRGRIDLAASFADGSRSTWLPFVSWSEAERRSLGGSDGGFELAIDIARSARPLVALNVRSDVALDALWIASRDDARSHEVGLRKATLHEPTLRELTLHGAAPHEATPHEAAWQPSDAESDDALDLEVPALSQYLAELPGDRGLCSPASLAMLLGFWGSPLGVADVAAGVRDASFGGTGNWAFNAAFAGALGFAAATAYLHGLAHARRFLEVGIPLALSLAWNEDELPGAPLPVSAGHLVVLRGFNGNGSVLVNDPAQPRVRVTYAAEAFERAWLGHGGVAYLVAPRARALDMLALANE